MRVEFERESFQKRDIICHDLFVGEIELVEYDVVYMVVRKQKIFTKQETLINLSSFKKLKNIDFQLT